MGSRTGAEEALSDCQLDLWMDDVLGMAAHHSVVGVPWSYDDPISGSLQLSRVPREIPSVAWYADLLVHHNAWCYCKR